MQRKKQCKSRSRTSETIKFLEDQLSANTKALSEGPARKKWSTHDLKSVKALTPTQEDLFHHFYSHDHICAHGSAGTGKTFLAAFLAIRELLRDDSKQNKIIIVRSAVATRDVGFLPGTLEDKVALYEQPYRDIFADLFGRRSTYDDMKAAGLIEFMPTSFIRGLTWDNSFVIVDEGQNLTFHEINSIMTRLGEHSRVIFTGDFPQTDLRKRGEESGMVDFIRCIDNMEDFARVQFTHNDIVRSRFVKSWIEASEKLGAA